MADKVAKMSIILCHAQQKGTQKTNHFEKQLASLLNLLRRGDLLLEELVFGALSLLGALLRLLLSGSRRPRLHLGWRVFSLSIITTVV